MSAFDIPPHSRGGVHLAMGLLALVAVAAFTQGFLRQLSSDTPAPPPRTLPGEAAIAEATPAPIPALQAPEPPKPRKAATAAQDDDAAAPTLDLPPAAGSPASGVTAPVAADAAATAPETPAGPTPVAPASAPAPEAAPT
jgi:hypothetical protein